VNLAVVLELEEEPVGALGRELGLEARRVAGGMGVEVGQVSPAQGDEVALGAQIVLDIDILAVARDLEGELGRAPGARGAGQADRVAVRGRRLGCGGG
jgi:hypothetical protein